MKPCPRCQARPAWRLGDGRFKCRACGARYSWKSVWDSIRLPETTRLELLHAFVDGVSAYRQRFDRGACVDSRERFYRLARACCAVDQHVLPASTPIIACKPRESRTAMRGWAQAREVVIVAIALENTAVRIAPLSFCNVEGIVPLLRRHVAVGGLYATHDEFAFANLHVRGDYVVIQRHSRAAGINTLIESFWEHTTQRLQMLRKIPRGFLHLYLGEMCLRFNHGESDAAPRLHELLQSLAMEDIKPLLRAATECVGPITSGADVQFHPQGRSHIGMTLSGD